MWIDTSLSASKRLPSGVRGRGDVFELNHGRILKSIALVYRRPDPSLRAARLRYYRADAEKPVDALIDGLSNMGERRDRTLDRGIKSPLLTS